MQKIFLKKIPELSDNTIIGFLDESSPQTTSNTQRLWSFTKPTISKNTTRLKANSFGFYALNGNSVIDFKENSKTESVCEFLDEIKLKNPDNKILFILNNFNSHRANATVE
ncbi:MAG: DDE superfamily endonuclease, partial [Candidatus Methanocomedens sp.]